MAIENMIVQPTSEELLALIVDVASMALIPKHHPWAKTRVTDAMMARDPWTVFSELMRESVQMGFALTKAHPGMDLSEIEKIRVLGFAQSAAILAMVAEGRAAELATNLERFEQFLKSPN